jgi:hypothetical protein
MAVTVPETRLPGVGALAAWMGAAQARDTPGQLKAAARTAARALPRIRFPGWIDMIFFLFSLRVAGAAAALDQCRFLMKRRYPSGKVSSLTPISSHDIHKSGKAANRMRYDRRVKVTAFGGQL